MRASWTVVEKALYVRGHLFHEDDMFPETVKKAFAMMVDIHGRDEWESGASRLVEPTGENIRLILAEKAEAEKEVMGLPALLDVDALGLPEPFAEEIKTVLELYALYVKGFRVCAGACFLSRKASMTGEAGDRSAARGSVRELRSYRDEVVRRFQGTHYPHYVYWLFDERRLDQLADDVEVLLGRIGG
jgi:hypothetical protein